MFTKKMFFSLIQALIIGLLMASPISVAHAEENGPIPPNHFSTDTASHEITSSPEGQALLQETLSRWDLYGVSADASQVHVFNFGSEASPDILVLPDGITFVSAESKATVVKDMDPKTREPRENKVLKIDGNLEMQVNADTNADTREISPNAASSWQAKQVKCYTRYQSSSAWMDTCYKTSMLSNDGDATKDYWGLEMYATAKSKTHWILRSAYVKATKSSSSPTMNWVDWSPKSDKSAGNCTSVQVGVSVKGIGLSGTYDLCDKWDITKEAAAGSFKNEWQGPFWGVWNCQAEREVAFTQAISVPQGKTPVWSLQYGYSAQP